MSYENLNKFVKYLRSFQEANLDVFAAVTGFKGMGKSTFTNQVVRRYVEKYFGETYYDAEKYNGFTNADVVEMITKLPECSPIIGDEAVRFALSRDWNKAENKEIVKLSTQIRTKKHIFFLNIPKLNWIDKAYREGMINMWVWIPTREYAYIFEPDANPGVTDIWHLDYFLKNAKRRVTLHSTPEEIYKIVKGHPCFWDVIKFPPLPQEIYDRYQRVRDKRVFEDINDSVPQKDTSKIMSYNIYKNWNDIVSFVEKSRWKRPTFEMIAKKLLRNPRNGEELVTQITVMNWIKDVEKGIPEEKKQKIEEQKPEEKPKEKEEEKKQTEEDSDEYTLV